MEQEITLHCFVAADRNKHPVLQSTKPYLVPLTPEEARKHGIKGATPHVLGLKAFSLMAFDFAPYSTLVCYVKRWTEAGEFQLLDLKQDKDHRVFAGNLEECLKAIKYWLTPEMAETLLELLRKSQEEGHSAPSMKVGYEAYSDLCRLIESWKGLCDGVPVKRLPGIRVCPKKKPGPTAGGLIPGKDASESEDETNPGEYPDVDEVITEENAQPAPLDSLEQVQGAEKEEETMTTEPAKIPATFIKAAKLRWEELRDVIHEHTTENLSAPSEALDVFMREFLEIGRDIRQTEEE